MGNLMHTLYVHVHVYHFDIRVHVHIQNVCSIVHVFIIVHVHVFIIIHVGSKQQF